MSLPASWETRKPVRGIRSHQAVRENRGADREAGLKGDSAWHVPVPSRTRHRAGQAGSSQPEPHAWLGRIGSHVPAHAANAPATAGAEGASGPRPAAPRTPEREKQQISSSALPTMPGRRGLRT